MKIKSNELAKAGDIKDLPFDYLWKIMVERMLPQFLKFYFPAILSNYNVQDAEYLNKELEHFDDSKTTKRTQRFVDKLIKVPGKLIPKKAILIHFEAQENANKTFIYRILEYVGLAYFHHKLPITSIAIISKASNKFTNYCSHNLHGLKFNFEFRDYQIMEQDENELKKSNNPFALVVLGAINRQKASKQTTDETCEKFYYLYRKLSQTRLRKLQLYSIYYFLAKCARLSLRDKEIFANFTKVVISITSNKNVMNIEQMLINQGKGEGKIETIQNILRDKDINFTVAKIASLFGVTEDVIRKVKRDLQSEAAKTVLA